MPNDRLKKGKGVFSVTFSQWFFHDVFSYGQCRVCWYHACSWAVWEIITTFLCSKCSIICLLTFDLYLAIECLFFPPNEQNPTFESFHPSVLFSILDNLL